MSAATTYILAEGNGYAARTIVTGAAPTISVTWLLKTTVRPIARAVVAKAMVEHRRAGLPILREAGDGLGEYPHLDAQIRLASAQ